MANTNTGKFNRSNVIGERPLTSTSDNRVIRYPAELGNDEFPAWISFFPLVRRGATTEGIASFQGSTKEFDQSGQMRMDPNHVTAAMAAAGAEKGLEASITAVGGMKLSDIMTQKGGKTTGKITGAVSSIAKAAGQVVAGTAAGGVAGALAARAVDEEQANTLMFGSRSICLGIHNSISQKYSANYDTADLGALVGAMGAGNTNMSGSLSNIMEGGGDLGVYGIRKAAAALGGPKMQAAMEAGTKKVENPYKEQLFKNMDFRTFTFEYKFAPKNRAEAESIFGSDGILKTFTVHMHPTAKNNGLYLVYPSEFLIVLYYKGKENAFIRKMSNCALVGMEVEYGGDGLQFFQGTDGMPTEATLKLSFSELETLTTQRVEAGF